MNDERIDFDVLIGAAGPEREDRVVRCVMAGVLSRPAPRPDLRAAIRNVAGPALVMATVVVLIVRVLPFAAAPSNDRAVTIGTALGISAAADRVIRGSQPATARQLLAALEGEP